MNTPFQVGASGSLIESPVNLKFVSEVDGDYYVEKLDNIPSTLPPANYQLSLTVGDDLHVESIGNANGQTVAHELSVNLPQAKTGIKNFKWSSNNNFNIKDTPKVLFIFSFDSIYRN